jgi:hypothetical protein
LPAGRRRVLGVAHHLSLAHAVALDRIQLGTAKHVLMPQIGAIGVAVSRRNRTRA